MNRIGALLLFGLLVSPSWAMSSSEEKPEDLPPPVSPGEAATRDPEELPPPVDPGEPAVPDSEETEEVPEVSTPPEIIYMSGPTNEEEVRRNTTSTSRNAPEPSTLLLTSLGATLLSLRAYRKKRSTLQDC